MSTNQDDLNKSSSEQLIDFDLNSADVHAQSDRPNSSEDSSEIRKDEKDKQNDCKPKHNKFLYYISELNEKIALSKPYIKTYEYNLATEYVFLPEFYEWDKLIVNLTEELRSHLKKNADDKFDKTLQHIADKIFDELCSVFVGRPRMPVLHQIANLFAIDFKDIAKQYYKEFIAFNMTSHCSLANCLLSKLQHKVTVHIRRLKENEEEKKLWVKKPKLGDKLRGRKKGKMNILY